MHQLGLINMKKK